MRVSQLISSIRHIQPASASSSACRLNTMQQIMTRRSPTSLFHHSLHYHYNPQFSLSLLSRRHFSSLQPLPPKPDYRTDPKGYSKYLWCVIKEELWHLWAGTKRLYRETKHCMPLFAKKWRGGEITRRERLLMAQTSADMMKLLPFSLIVIIPAAELALPAILYFFPNFLPSTFVKPEDAHQRHQNELLAKSEFVQFLRSTSRAVSQSAHHRVPLIGEFADGKSASALAAEFRQLMDQIQNHQYNPTNSDILYFLPLFKESLTLNNLNIPELEAMAQLLSIPIGKFDSAKKMRKLIIKQLNHIREDDEFIRLEGIDSLTEEELRFACRQRGIASNQSIEYMKRKINEWVELSLDYRVPESLLIYSRVFSQKWSNKENLKLELIDTVKSMPNNVINSVKENSNSSIHIEEIHRKQENRDMKTAEKIEKKANELENNIKEKSKSKQ